MTFLPIVQRELRAAARRRSTFRVRWWAVVLGLGLTFISLLFVMASGRRSVGNPLFSMLTGYAFGVAMLAGVFLTSDALTEEKREGTLGLLFLTDLKGYDVVLGKFIAQSLNAFYCLLALLPVTALPMLFGGVVGAEFWRMALGLANTLFFSLAAGMCVSACMRDSQRAMANTLGLLLLLVAALPLLRGFVGSLRIPAFWSVLALVSPLYPYVYSAEILYPRHSGTYWGSLAASNLLGWLFLGAASLVLPRMVQERAWLRKGRREAARSGPPPRVCDGHAARVSGNPVQWLRRDELGFPWLFWMIVLASTTTVALLVLFGGADSAIWLGEATRPFGFLLKVLFAIQACRFFVEARRSGAMELLLSTALTDQEIIRGQIKALWLTFAWPVGVFVVGLFASFAVRVGTALAKSQYDLLMASLGGVFFSTVYSLRLVADLFAILWFGMGLALTSKKPSLAPALTILFVLVLPGPLSFCWIDILIDLVFISWGTNKCRQNLRRLIAG
ncbi:MAG TPA: ABC transporter permease subunit [Verrucomicrobiae bacterium]